MALSNMCRCSVMVYLMNKISSSLRWGDCPTIQLSAFRPDLRTWRIYDVIKKIRSFHNLISQSNSSELNFLPVKYSMANQTCSKARGLLSSSSKSWQKMMNDFKERPFEMLSHSEVDACASLEIISGFEFSAQTSMQTHAMIGLKLLL